VESRLHHSGNSGIWSTLSTELCSCLIALQHDQTLCRSSSITSRHASGDPVDSSEAGSEAESEGEVQSESEVGSEAGSYVTSEVSLGGFAYSKHVTISNGLNLVDAKLVYQAVKGVLQIGQHEEDLYC